MKKPRKPSGPARPAKSKSPGKRTQRAQKSKAFRKERKQRSAKSLALRKPQKPPRKPGAPAAARAEALAARPDPSRPRALSVARAGLDKKAEDVLVLDVRGLTSYADYFVVMTADSERQAGAIADHVDERLKAEGASKVGVEGYESGRWILVDYGDVVAHVLSKDARGFYDLEGLWADAPRVKVE
jgi:ribosome-associated protein